MIKKLKALPLLRIAEIYTVLGFFAIICQLVLTVLYINTMPEPITLHKFLELIESPIVSTTVVVGVGMVLKIMGLKQNEK